MIWEKKKKKPKGKSKKASKTLLSHLAALCKNEVQSSYFIFFIQKIASRWERCQESWSNRLQLHPCGAAPLPGTLPRSSSTAHCGRWTSPHRCLGMHSGCCTQFDARFVHNCCTQFNKYFLLIPRHLLKAAQCHSEMQCWYCLHEWGSGGRHVVSGRIIQIFFLWLQGSLLKHSPPKWLLQLWGR